jgi:hypothetical protein
VEEFEVQKCISNVIVKDKNDTSMTVLILALNQLIGRKTITKIGNEYLKIQFQDGQTLMWIIL